MTPDEAVVQILDTLDSARIPYMVVGSLASNIHGIPRSTRDADVVVELEAATLRALESGLAPGLALSPQGGFEAVTGTMRYLIRLAGSAFVCELFGLSDDAHDRARFARRTAIQAFGRTLFVATAEDTVITKLRWASEAGRTKDRDDVRNILAVRADELDWAYLNRWTTAHGTAALLATIRGSIPPA